MATLENLILTAEDVCPHLGFDPETIDPEQLTVIQQQLDLWQIRLIEDYFEPWMLAKMSANQIARARLGLGKWIAAETLGVHSKQNSLRAGGTAGDGGSESFTIGPLHFGGTNWGWAGGGTQLKNTSAAVKEMKDDAENILETLKIAIRGSGRWQAI